MPRTVIASLQRFAEAVAAGLLAIIFVAFIIQIVLRYAFNWPVGWTSEVSVIAWLWLVLWGAAFVLKDHEEIRIDMLSALLGRRARIAMGILGALSMVLLFGMSLPAAYAYVSFMKVEKSAYMHIRFDALFSIYIMFSVAVIARNLWNIWQLLHGKDPAGPDPMQPGSAL
jgi:TRAP-type C4-dicarboxylate transport system permease small subunit